VTSAHQLETCLDETATHEELAFAPRQVCMQGRRTAEVGGVDDDVVEKHNLG
jgi:hypothetical protein